MLLGKAVEHSWQAFLGRGRAFLDEDPVTRAIETVRRPFRKQGVSGRSSLDAGSFLARRSCGFSLLASLSLSANSLCLVSQNKIEAGDVAGTCPLSVKALVTCRRHLVTLGEGLILDGQLDEARVP